MIIKNSPKYIYINRCVFLIYYLYNAISIYKCFELALIFHLFQKLSL